MAIIKSDMVRARIEPAIKERAEAVLEKLGMSTADAIRLLLTQIALRQAFPLELTLPPDERLPEEK
ncbi:type II toxin-antitoxin system RelB/DinJ family antitoxin [Pseudaeromonas paramecii]|uniref:Type II toxin-antitoxin system RelB/DinJ family antitoxin n=1 Tax=Pseudaeromonas paramecii TaxID=2138166 RepID=A0ABP8QEH4_9GAMM